MKKFYCCDCGVCLGEAYDWEDTDAAFCAACYDLIAQEDAELEAEEDFDDSMDGDHDSAMTSCGWGTDEDYGYYGEDF